MHTNCAMLGGMLGALRRIWDLRKTHQLGWWAVLGAVIALLLTLVLENLAGNAVTAFFNDVIVSQFGSLLPHVWQVIASHFISFVAAVGLLWIALSAGYWLGVRDPVSVSNNNDQAPPDDEQENENRRGIALGAARAILEKLKTVDRIVDQTYSGKENARDQWLAKYRPELQANVQLLVGAGFVVPPCDHLDPWEASGLLKYAEEVEPFLARKQLFPQAKERAARITVTIEEILAEHRKS